MKQYQSVRTAVRFTLTAGLAASLSIPVVASAQNNTKSPANLGKINVTGTRIKRTSIVTSQPITTVTHQDIEQTGLKSVGDILSELPSVIENQRPTLGFSSNGSSTIELRNLGSNRLIVLVDGKRWVTNLSGVTDINQIPISIVDHIEILQDGASAVYGSDAIAGAVNIITKKDFNGAEASAYYGIDEGENTKRNGGGQTWDGQTEHYDVTLGMSNDKGHFIINGSYRTSNGIPSPARTFGNFSQQLPGRGSSATPQGRFLFNPPYGGDPSTPGNPPASSTGLTLNQCPDVNYGSGSESLYLPSCDLTIRKGASGQSPADYRPYSSRDGYYDTFEPISGDQDIKSVYGAGAYDLLPQVTVDTSFLYQRRQSLVPQSADLLFLTRQNEMIPAGQEYNPFGFTLSHDPVSVPDNIAPNAARPDKLGAIYRRTNEFGRRSHLYDVRSFRFQGGFKGSFSLGQTSWDWNADYIYMTTDENSTHNNIINTETLEPGLLGPGVCGALVGCIPLNLFGGQGAKGNGSITPAQANRYSYNSLSTSGSELRVLDANVSSSDIFDLPGGPLGIAAGYQHRNLSGQFKPDEIATIKSGHNLVPSVPEQGSYYVDAVYGELNVPILSKLPGVHYLATDVATRYSDYSTFGSTVNTRVGVKYQPIEDLVLRGSYAEGFRAASIDELFSPTSQGLASVKDPCSNYTASGAPAQVVQECQAESVPPNFVQQVSQIHFISGGNPKVDPETSISKTLGFVYSPSWLPGFDLNADYYHIKLENTIQGIGVQLLLDECYRQGVQQACGKVTRTRFGRINNVDNPLTNIGTTKTAGLDIGARYKFPSTPFGDFTLDIHGTRTYFYKRFSPRGDGTTAVTTLVHNTGVEGTSIPVWKAVARLNYDYGPWSANITARYHSGLTTSCSDFEDNTPISYTNLGFCSDPNFENNSLSLDHIASAHWFNAQVSYATPWNVQLTVGARNIFEAKPPSGPGGGFNPVLDSDLIGRFLYGQVQYEF